MLELLKSGRINNRLLCEMALHKDFRRLMVDIEVYVDRIASMRIKDLNTVLEVTRAQLQAKCDGDETALDLRTIESAITDEDEYFSYTVHNDIDRIIRHIREAHKDEATTADIAAVSEAVVNACKSPDGAYYEYPLCMPTHCMAINYEVFEAAGALQYIDEETRTWTTEGFEAAMAAIKTAIDNGTVTVATPGIVYCGAQGGDQGTRALVNNLYSDYYVTEDGTSYNANSANNVKALTLLQNMVNAGALSANASYAAADELQAFANQTCAVSFCWNFSNYSQYADQTQFTPFAMAFPSDDGTPELEMAGPYGFGIFDNKDQAKIDAAKKFIDFVCNDATAGVEAVKTSSFFPVHSDWGDVYADAEDADLRAPFALMSNYLGRYYNLTGGWTEQRALWWPMLAEILTTGADVQTAADNFVSQANANIG